MPSPPNASNGEVDVKAEAITALCHFIMSCDDFKADNNKIAEHLNIAQAKNVPRKINSIIAPYGFELLRGKVVLKGSRDTGATDNVPPTPKKAAKAAKTPKASPAKKRKVKEVEADTSGSDKDGA